jgi:hypothetical protein
MVFGFDFVLGFRHRQFANSCQRQFVVSKTGKAYDAQTKGLNRKSRLEAFYANPRLADFGVCGDVDGGRSLPCAG